jgi:hypothetical protein
MSNQAVIPPQTAADMIAPQQPDNPAEFSRWRETTFQALPYRDREEQEVGSWTEVALVKKDGVKDYRSVACAGFQKALSLEPSLSLDPPPDRIMSDSEKEKYLDYCYGKLREHAIPISVPAKPMEQQQAAAPHDPRERLSIDLERNTIAQDGRQLGGGPVDPIGLRIVERLSMEKGAFVTGSEISDFVRGCKGDKGIRRALKRLPPDVRKLVKSKRGTGRRLELP